MKNEIGVVSKKESCLFIIMGFKDLNGYGEVYVKDKDTTTFAFRGFGRQKVINKAKKQMLLNNIDT